MNRDELVNQYINIVNKMAYSFCKTTGHEFEDLRSEGIVGMLQAINKFDESRGTKLSTVIYASCRNSMINYVKKANKVTSFEFYDIECHHAPGQNQVEFLNSLNGLGIEARQMAKMILLAPTTILRIARNSSPRSVKSALKQRMKDLGYSQQDIDFGIKELKSILNS